MRFHHDLNAEPAGELSSDLEWMLQSGQVNQPTLVRTLAGEFYSQIFWIGYSLLGDPEAARCAAIAALTDALLNVYRYRGETSPRTWLLRIALQGMGDRRLRQKRQRLLRTLRLAAETGHPAFPLTKDQLEIVVWKAVDRLKEIHRTTLLLYYAHDWTLSEISAVLQTSEASLPAALTASRLRILKAIRKSGAPEEYLVDSELEGFLRRVLRAHWRVPAGTYDAQTNPEDQNEHEIQVEQNTPVSQSRLEEISAEVLRQAHQNGKKREGTAYLKEILLIGLVILLAVGVLRSMPDQLMLETNLATATQSPPVPIQVTFVVAQQNAPTASPTPPVQIPTWTPLPPQPAIFPFIRYQAQPGDTLDSIASRAGTAVEFLKQLNMMPADIYLYPGQNVYLDVENISMRVKLLSTPAPALVEKPPLSMSSDSEAIRERILDHQVLWRNLWADVLTTRYGPPSYSGPPLLTRSQVWSSQPGKVMELTGHHLEPVSALLVLQGLPFQSDLNRIHAWEYAPGLLDDPLIRAFRPEEYLFPVETGWIQEGTFFPIRLSKIAGREALLADWQNDQGKVERRLFVDAKTGVVLGGRQFDAQELPTAIADFMVSAIQYDIDFPDEIFDLRYVWPPYFVRDYRAWFGKSGVIKPTGRLDLNNDPSFFFQQVSPTGLPPTPADWLSNANRQTSSPGTPPQDFDPARSQLKFHWSQNPDIAGDWGVPVTVMSDGYYLGAIAVGSIWDLSCQRSPDGLWIAYATDRLDHSPNLHWFALNKISARNQIALQDRPKEFRFSPDSQQLAFFGSPWGLRDGIGVYLLDLETKSFSRLIPVETARSLVWSPDGQSLAMISWPGANEEGESWLVVDATSGEVIYRAPFDPANPSPPSNWPGKNWGIAFPIEQNNPDLWGTMEQCAAPPGE